MKDSPPLVEKPPHACLYPTKEEILAIIRPLIDQGERSMLPLMGAAMRGCRGMANPSVVARYIQEALDGSLR